MAVFTEGRRHARGVAIPDATGVLVAAVVTVRWIEGEALREGGPGDLGGLREAGTTVWVDVLSPDEEALAPIAETFSLHALEVEDCLHTPQRPKVDDYEDHMLITWHAVERADGDGLIYKEMDSIIGRDYLVTVHEDAIPALDAVAGDAVSILGRGADWTFHALLDRIVDSVFPIVDYVSDELDEIEDKFLTGARQADLHRLYSLKRMLVSLHRTVSAERDVIRSLARQEAPISGEAYLYFQDVGDHLARVTDAVDTYRDVASGAMDIYLSSQSNRLNEIMKRLTVVATIIMPLTLISGIYGMNTLGKRDAWGMWPPPESSWGFGSIIVFMVAVAVVMFWDFRRRDWW